MKLGDEIALEASHYVFDDHIGSRRLSAFLLLDLVVVSAQVESLSLV